MVQRRNAKTSSSAVVVVQSTFGEVRPLPALTIASTAHFVPSAAAVSGISASADDELCAIMNRLKGLSLLSKIAGKILTTN